jgi:hypothetical protein
MHPPAIRSNLDEPESLLSAASERTLAEQPFRGDVPLFHFRREGLDEFRYLGRLNHTNLDSYRATTSVV